MKRFAFSFVLLTGLLFAFAQCKSADAAEKTANEFFSAILEKDFAKAESMMEPPIGNARDFAEQLEYLQNNPSNGQLVGFKKSIGFSTKIKNGITRVELPYVLNYENGDLSFKVIVQNRGGGNKIASVQ